MNLFCLYIFLCSILFSVLSAPVDPNKKDKEHDKDGNKVEFEDLGIEYGRYLQEVVAVLEQDKEFAKKLENVTSDHIKTGAIASELNFVNHQVRSKLDELKRMEMDRIKKLTRKETEAKEYGGSYDIEGSRNWRTLGGSTKTQQLSKFEHVDHGNPHSFEVQDLHRLIVSATKDLEDLDKKRRDEFKQYEMEKELQYRENLKNMTEEDRKEVETKHKETVEKHKDHPRIHHPGSKQQLEEVWEEQDHLPKEEFSPKTFFMLHDIDGDSYLNPDEVEALLSVEIKKLYDPNNPEDDPNEMMEEYHRMREHIYNEADKNKDGLISKKEFLDMTARADFDKDEGWKGLDEEDNYNEDELREYEKHREDIMAKQYNQFQYQKQYVPQHPQQVYHDQYPQGQHHPGGPPQGQFHGGPQMQPEHPQNGVPNAQFRGGPPPPQPGYQQNQIHPGGVPQQMHPGMVPQQMHPGGVPQQIHPGGGSQQIHPAGVPQQIHPGGVPQQLSPQQLNALPQQHFAANGQPGNQQYGQGIGQHPGGLGNQGLPPQQHPVSSQANAGNPQQGVPSIQHASASNQQHANNIPSNAVPLNVPR